MQITFDFPKQQINIEGQELELVELLKLVREIAPKIPSINIVTQTSKTPPAAITSNGDQPRDENNGGRQTMRQFVRSIDLGNISERIAAIGYYLKTHANRPCVSPKEMGDLFVQCGFQKPTQMAVAVFDAKRKYGFMESAGHGLWRISTQGENLIMGKLENAVNAQPQAE
jgi:hypothetical protein